MRKLILCTRVARRCWSLLAAAATAQPKKGGDGERGKVKVYDFSGDTIEGDLVKPEGTTSTRATSRSTRR